MEDQWIYNALFRLTYQMTPKNKITAYYDRYPKFKGHEMGALTDPETAAARRDWRHANYFTGQVEVHVDRHQPPAPRGGLLHERRVPLHRLSARRAEGPRITRLVHDDRESRSHKPWHGDESRHRLQVRGVGRPHDSGQRHRSEEVRDLDLVVVCDRIAQPQGRVSVGLRQLCERVRHQRRPRAALSQRRAGYRSHLQHAVSAPRSS